MLGRETDSEQVAGFRRFANMIWSILTPARLKVGAMLKEMPKKYWKNMPETALIGDLVKGAQARESEMVARSAAAVGDNAEKSWAAVRAEAIHCTRCDLYKCATQTVFGEGPLDARILFVGEQPGDQEDLAGRPFVGPAGQLFDRALADAGIDRERTYVTNAVKHFKFERRGKRRIHDKPNGGEIAACRWWLQQELALIRPPVTVALGATAARALFGKAVTIASLRGQGPRARRRRRGLGHRPPELPAPGPRRQGGGICPLRRGSRADRQAGEGAGLAVQERLDRRQIGAGFDHRGNMPGVGEPVHRRVRIAGRAAPPGRRRRSAGRCRFR